MKTRLPRFGALTVVACLGLLGCEHWRDALRQDGTASTSTKADADAKIFAGERSDSVRAGALSGKAREIESHFSGQ